MLPLKFLSHLPLRLLYLVSDGLFLIIYYLWRFRLDLTITNLRNSFPERPEKELRKIARKAYRNGCDLVAEVLHMSGMEREELARRVKIENAGAVSELVGAGRSVVLLASHHCNWEWLLLALCNELKVGVDAVYKPLRVAAVDRFMLHARSQFGGNPIPAQNFMSEVMRRRQGPRVFALVADQTPPQQEPKHWTRFLNQDTAFFVGAESIARITRSPVFFVGMRRVRRGHYEAKLELLSEPPYASEDCALIERYVRSAEAHIARYPEDWLWMYRKWKYKKPVYS